MSAFVAYIPAGYPDINTTREILLKLNELPVTGVEIGVPFSDPVADGDVIQRAYNMALKNNNVSLNDIFEMLGSVELRYDLYIMSYLNPIASMGFDEVCKRMKNVNVKGLIIPDLPLVESKNLDIKCPLVPFVAPNTPDEQIELINNIKAPFIYYIGRYGVTGERGDLPMLDHLQNIKSRFKLPVYMGFGISSAEQVRKVSEIADGVIVGSSIVKEILANPDKAALKVYEKVKSLCIYA